MGTEPAEPGGQELVAIAPLPPGFVRFRSKTLEPTYDLI